MCGEAASPQLETSRRSSVSRPSWGRTATTTADSLKRPSDIEATTGATPVFPRARPSNMLSPRPSRFTEPGSRFRLGHSPSRHRSPRTTCPPCGEPQSVSAETSQIGHPNPSPRQASESLTATASAAAHVPLVRARLRTLMRNSKCRWCPVPSSMREERGCESSFTSSHDKASELESTRRR